MSSTNINVNHFLIFELVTFTFRVITCWYLESLWMVEKLFALLITLILPDPACDILARMPQMKRFNDKDINLNYQLTHGQHPVCTCIPAWLRDQKWSNIMSVTCWIFIFSHWLITGPICSWGFIVLPSQVHHLDITPCNYSSWPSSLPLSFFLVFTASSILNHNPCLWGWRTSSN